MIAVDTNVLVRALVDRTDDAEQQRRARQALLSVEAAGEELFLSSLVVAEMAWVLRRAAQLSRGEIAQILEALLALPHVRWEDRVAVTDGVRALRSGGPGLADHLIRGAALRAGARTLLTFDAQLLKLGGCSTP